MPIKLKALALWVLTSLEPTKSFNDRHTSYGLKHMASHDLGIYFSNEEFKGVMVKLGYRVRDRTEPNWVFNVSERSIARICERPMNRLIEKPFDHSGRWNDKFLI